MKFINILLLILVILVLIVVLTLYAINSVEVETGFDGLKEITGATQTFEVPHEKPSYGSELYQQVLRADQTEKYNKKYFSYLLSKQESRRDTFFR
jgi:competence protein ComGC